MRARRKMLVTAGPTVEDIDEVRYISNRSSGRMGFEVARAAARRGWDVTLVTGPVALKTPRGVHRVDVRSAAEMYAACRRIFPDVDAAVMTAAVADYTPARKARGKLKKSGRPMLLRLVPTVDILARMGSRKRAGQALAGFALEAGGVSGGRTEAARKLKAKNLDLIVLNGPESFGGKSAAFAALDSTGLWTDLGRRSKAALASWLVRRIEERLGGRAVRLGGASIRHPGGVS
ncbi:MAG: phosphopantothenoylcysteine decarboxylase [Planctomycetota bacterium]|nr:phosphopantothenoylcysteine decarboxylase [Planctomycetota bacterium]